MCDSNGEVTNLMLGMAHDCLNKSILFYSILGQISPRGVKRVALIIAVHK